VGGRTFLPSGGRAAEVPAPGQPSSTLAERVQAANPLWKRGIAGFSNVADA
jgi:hypothetical protein